MSLQYLASFSINLRPRKEILSPPGVNKRINKICRIVRRTQRHHSIETNFFCFKDDFEWKVKARDRFQFFLLSLNLKNMLIVIPFGNKNNWENYTFYEIAKSLRLIGVFLGIFILLHGYHTVLCWKPNFTIFMILWRVTILLYKLILISIENCNLSKFTQMNFFHQRQCSRPLATPRIGYSKNFKLEIFSQSGQFLWSVCLSAGKTWSLTPATLLKVTIFHECFSRFLNCINSTKSCKASYIACHEILTKKIREK